jgi:hypothetical protein
MTQTATRSATALSDGERSTLPQPSPILPSSRTISIADAIRAFSVMAGPSALFDLFLLGSVIATIRRLLFRPRTPLVRRLRPLEDFGTALAVVYPTVIRPWMLRWGTSEEERRTRQCKFAVPSSSNESSLPRSMRRFFCPDGAHIPARR